MRPWPWPWIRGWIFAGLLGAVAAAAAPLEWVSLGTNRYARVTPEGTGEAGFTRMPAAALGITFTNRVADDRSRPDQTT